MTETPRPQTSLRYGEERKDTPRGARSGGGTQLGPAVGLQRRPCYQLQEASVSPGSCADETQRPVCNPARSLLTGPGSSIPTAVARGKALLFFPPLFFWGGGGGAGIVCGVPLVPFSALWCQDPVRDFFFFPQQSHSGSELILKALEPEMGLTQLSARDC